MSNVIKFPGSDGKNFNMEFKPKIAYPTDQSYKMFVGAWTFTCQKCQAKCIFDSKNMIFRMIEFYCTNCGVFHRVSNPAFFEVKK
jgi:late competence protein required for DNA uptake (superfamily II DNA/RNA helicase)